MKSFLSTLCLSLIICSALATFNRQIPDKFCLRYSKASGKVRCETIGNRSSPGSMSFFKLISKVTRTRLPNFINGCIGYNSRGFCDYCVKGRAFNGKSCEKCIKRPFSERGGITSDSCEYPWVQMIDAAIGSRQSGIMGSIRDNCRRYFFKRGRKFDAGWDMCIRKVSKLRYPMLIVSPSGSDRSWSLNRRGYNMIWKEEEKNSSNECSNDIFAQGSCNCYATSLGSSSCSTCNIGFSREGVLDDEMDNDAYFDSSKDDMYKTETFGSYEHYKCTKTTVENCDIMRPNWDVSGSEFKCAHCNIRKGFKQNSNGECVL